MDHMMHHVEQYAKTLENATVKLQEEKQRADLLLYRMLPRFVLGICSCNCHVSSAKWQLR